MPNLHDVYPIGHRVFQGGRYIRAFDHLPDIDHFEHSILTYLGSLMPFDKSFTDYPAFPSVATIASSTKISAATVRSRLKTLQAKGYINVKEVRFLNMRGRFQQSSNNYFLSQMAFQFFDDIIQSRDRIGKVMKRAVGESFSFAVAEPSPSPEIVGSYEAREDPVSAVVPNSLPQIPDEDPTDRGSYRRDLFTMKAEVDRIAKAYEELLNIPVSKSEKERFLREYVRTNGNEIYYSERLLQIAADPYLTSRTKSLNFLFSGLDCAIKNRAEIVKRGTLALLDSRTEDQLNETLKQIPQFVESKSRQFGQQSDAIIRHLFREPLAEARKSLGLPHCRPIPSNDRELKNEVERLLNARLPDTLRSELQIIADALPRLNFSYCLQMFERFLAKLEVVEAQQ